jgi:ribokinase
MPSKAVRVVVVGSANTDLITYSERFPEPGETLFGEAFALGFGGKGANQAVAAKLCGAKVDLVARVGDDLFGTATVKNLKSLGIGTRHVTKAKSVSSGVASIWVDETGQNRIVVVKGANDRLTKRAAIEATKTLQRADIIVLQFEIPISTTYHMVRFAHKNGIRCILNPAPACRLDLKRWTSVDYLVPNESEAAAITGMPVRSENEAKACARFLLSRGLRRVIITLGAQGALLASATGMKRIPPFPIEPIDTTGAGDAFIGSFATFVAEGVPEQEAVAKANLYAALSTTRKGTQTSFLDRASFDHQWKKHWAANEPK